MTIVSCYIENFGTLHRQSFEFTAGINVVRQDNGWGKSTLAAFIKAMLYGMEYRRGGKELNDRRRYSPWQGGAFGGWLTFEHCGKVYKVERFFGAKDSDDTFSLYDMDTNLPSGDFSEAVGEEILGLNLESFERSIFVTLDGKAPVMTDNINAKLNDLIENADDIGGYENAMSRLDSLATELRAKRGGGGLIGALSEKIQRLEADLAECGGKAAAIEATQLKISDARSEKDLCEAELAGIDEMIANLDRAAKKREHTRLVAVQSQIRMRLSEFEAFFGGAIPAQSELDAAAELAADASALSKAIAEPVTESDRTRLIELEAFFAAGVPDEADIEACQDDISQYSSALAARAGGALCPVEAEKLSELSSRFAQGAPEPRQLDAAMQAYNRAISLSGRIDSESAKLDFLRVSMAGGGRHGGGAWIILLVLAVCGFLIGGVGFALDILPLGAGSIAVGAVLLAAALIIRGSAKPKGGQSAAIDEMEQNISTLTSEKDTLESEYISLLRRYFAYYDLSNVPAALGMLRGDAERYAELSAKAASHAITDDGGSEAYRAAYSGFIEKYPVDHSDPGSALAGIRRNAAAYARLSRAIAEYDESLAKLRRVQGRLDEFTGRYPVSDCDGSSRKLTKIRDTLRDLDFALAQLSDAEAELIRFESENDMAGLENLPESALDPAELRSAQAQCRARLGQLSEMIAGYNRDIDRDSIVVDRRQELEAELTRATEELERLGAKYATVTSTMQLLDQAKTNLSLRYMDAMKRAFFKYVSMLGGGENMQIDLRLGVQAESDGKLRDKSFFSAGYKDLADVCTRLALADAMFAGDCPLLIMDDPFINLDDIRLEKALEMMRRLAAEKQVIYCVCHGSRVPG